MAKETTNEDLAQMIHGGFEEASKDRAAIRDEMKQGFAQVNVRFTKIENQLKSVENYKVTQLQLIQILRERKVLTKQDAAALGVS